MRSLRPLVGKSSSFKTGDTRQPSGCPTSCLKPHPSFPSPLLKKKKKKKSCKMESFKDSAGHHAFSATQGCLGCDRYGPHFLAWTSGVCSDPTAEGRLELPWGLTRLRAQASLSSTWPANPQSRCVTLGDTPSPGAWVLHAQEPVWLRPAHRNRHTHPG